MPVERFSAQRDRPDHNRFPIPIRFLSFVPTFERKADTSLRRLLRKVLWAFVSSLQVVSHARRGYPAHRRLQREDESASGRNSRRARSLLAHGHLGRPLDGRPPALTSRCTDGNFRARGPVRQPTREAWWIGRAQSMSEEDYFRERTGMIDDP
jgi:hypothetical protein